MGGRNLTLAMQGTTATLRERERLKFQSSLAIHYLVLKHGPWIPDLQKPHKCLHI